MSNIDSVNMNASFEVSVLCVPGVRDELKDNYFVDGRLRDWLDSSIVNLVSKRDLDDGIYAVTSDMDVVNREDNSYVSLVRELDAFQEKYDRTSGYLDSKTRVLGEMLEDVENYVHTISLSSNIGRTPSVACLYVKDGHFTASTLGDSVIYRYRDDMLVPLCNISDNVEKVSRLIELGIVAEKEAGMYEKADSSKRLFQLPQDKFRTGDVIVLCSGASSKYLNEDRIALLCTADNTNSALSDMMRGALIEGYEDDLTVMIIKVKDNFDEMAVMEDDAVFTKRKYNGYDDGFEEDYSQKTVKMSALIAGVIASVLCLVIGLAIGYTVLPAVLGGGEKPMVAPTHSVGMDIEEGVIGHDVTMAPIPTRKPKTNKTPKPSPRASATAKPTAKPTVKPTVKPTPKPVGNTTSADGDMVVTATESDTYWGIASKYCKDTSNSTMNKIAKASGKASIDEYIHAGDKIVIPQSLLK